MKTFFSSLQIKKFHLALIFCIFISNTLFSQAQLRNDQGSTGGLFWVSSGSASDGLPNARITEHWGPRASMLDSRFVLSTKTSMLVGYASSGENWGYGNLFVQNRASIGTTAQLYPLHVRVGDNLNLQFRNETTYTSSSALINATNDNNNTHVPLKFAASSYTFSGGNVKINADFHATGVIKANDDIYTKKSIYADGDIYSGDLIADGDQYTFGTIFLPGTHGSFISSSPYIKNEVGYHEGVHSNQRLSFGTSGVERMAITDSGAVGIGTMPNKALLHVKGSFHVENSTGNQVFHVSSGKELVFVGSKAYDKYTTSQGNSNGVINQNNFSLWVSKGIVSEDYAIDSVSDWSDYVFAENYSPMSLPKLADYIKTNRHLPAIPSEAEVRKNGYSLVKLNQGFLKTMEELTLYAIDQEKKIDALSGKISLQDAAITELQAKTRQYEKMLQDVEKLKAQMGAIKK